jgi:hypothetical protein
VKGWSFFKNFTIIISQLCGAEEVCWAHNPFLYILCKTKVTTRIVIPLAKGVF